MGKLWPLKSETLARISAFMLWERLVLGMSLMSWFMSHIHAPSTNTTPEFKKPAKISEERKELGPFFWTWFRPVIKSWNKIPKVWRVLHRGGAIILENSLVQFCTGRLSGARELRGAVDGEKVGRERSGEAASEMTRNQKTKSAFNDQLEILITMMDQYPYFTSIYKLFGRGEHVHFRHKSFLIFPKRLAQPRVEQQKLIYYKVILAWAAESAMWVSSHASTRVIRVTSIIYTRWVNNEKHTKRLQWSNFPSIIHHAFNA